MFKKLGTFWITTNLLVLIALAVLVIFALVHYGIIFIHWLGGLSPLLWLIVLGIIIVIFIGYLFRKKLNFDSISQSNYAFIRNAFIYFFAVLGACFFLWYIVLNKDTDSTAKEPVATITPYDAFAGMRTLDFGPLTAKSGESLQVQVLNGQGYWIHPVHPGTYIVTIKDMRDVVLCKTKIVKVQGKSAQFISLIPPPADVVIESYKVTFDRGGDFIVSPDMAL